jgi:hypothetical protein
MKIETRMQLNRARAWVRPIALLLLMLTVLCSIGATYFLVTAPAQSLLSGGKAVSK